MNARSSVIFGLSLAVAACGGAPAAVTTPKPPPPVASAPPPPPAEPERATPDAPFRQQAPAPEGKIGFVAPKVQELRLKNGLRVLLAERHDLPVVAVRLVVTSGAGDVAGARPGAMSFLGSMLEQGSSKRDALQISDDYEALGAQHGAWLDWDSGGVSIKVLADKLDPALEIMRDVALAPTFSDKEIERLRARRIAALQAEKSAPAAAAQNTLAAALFGRGHPYGSSLSGQELDAQKLTRPELVKAYEALFRPENAAIVVAGDVTKDTLAAKLEASFGGWRSRHGTKPKPAAQRGPKTPARVAASKRIVVVDRPGAQSQVQVARIGVPFSTKDREPIVIANAILGGMFSSRVNMNLREKHAYTYGARSYFSMRHGAGPFIVAAPVVADKTAASIREILSELEGLKRDGPTDDELSLAKESLRLAMPGRFETVADVATAIAELVVHDLPLDDYDRRLARIEAVTAADVKRVATQYLDPAAMTVIVVGDKAKLAPELDKLGLGAFEERDPYGNALEPAAKPARP